jgi:hypothetical protein
MAQTLHRNGKEPNKACGNHTCQLSLGQQHCICFVDTPSSIPLFPHLSLNPKAEEERLITCFTNS